VIRRTATRRPRSPSLSKALAVIERLEPRAMLAGLGQDSLSGLGSTTAVLLPGVSSPTGIVLTGGSPTPGSTAGTGGSQSTSPVLLSVTGSGTSSTPSGTGSSSTPNGPVLQSGSGSATGSSTSVSFGASKPAMHRRLKTGHQVGGTGWKNPLLRTCVQGVSVQFVPSVPVFRSAAASPPRNRRAFPVGALAGFGPASTPPSAGRLCIR
jgi:hypothetical protein